MVGSSFFWWKENFKTAGCVFLFIYLASLAGIFTRPLGNLAAFWPANALLLGLMVRFPRLSTPFGWSAAILGYFAADLMTGGKFFVTAILTAGNIIGVVTGFFLLSRVGEAHRRLRQPLSVLYLTSIVATAAATAGLVGAVADPLLFGGHPMQGWIFWFITEWVNYIAILPVILTMPDLSWPKAERRRSALKRISGRQLFPALALILSCTLGVLIGGPGALAFPVPSLLWCALTYSLFSTAVFTLLFSAWTLVAISVGYLSVAIVDMNSHPMLLSIRLGVSLVALAPLTVASIFAARNELLLRLQYAASHDQLSGLLNRRAFHDQSMAALKGLAAEKRPVAVLMLDIDYFKRINDTYGHAAGDQVLVAFASLASQCLRDTDAFGRVGGEEFAALLYDCDRREAEIIAQRVGVSFATTQVALTDGRNVSATVSIGAAFARQAVSDIESLLLVADKALYRAKEAGRNRIEGDELSAAV